MHEQITTRLQELRQEYARGQTHLQELELQAAGLRETLLRISGAVQVLEEMLAGSAPDVDAGATGASNPA